MACLVINFVWNVLLIWSNTQRRSRPTSESSFHSSFSTAERLRATRLVLRACNGNYKGITRELQENYNPFAEIWSHRKSRVLPKRLTFNAPGETFESYATYAFGETFIGSHLKHLMFRWEPAGSPQVHLIADVYIKRAVELSRRMIKARCPRWGSPRTDVPHCSATVGWKLRPWDWLHFDNP